MINNYIKILCVDRQKIPSWKVDIGRNLPLQSLTVPKKTHILGHFHLKTIIIGENYVCNQLIF